MSASNLNRLNGKVALVTGAADGPKAALGSIFAAGLAAEGAKVVLADLRDCRRVADEIRARGGAAQSHSLDVRDHQAVERMFKAIDAEFGRLDILVNNAATGSNIPPISIESMTVDAWDECMAVNLRGTFLCSKNAIPLMRRNNYGKIINLSSTTILSGLSHRLHYVASKGAIAAMTRAMALELGEFGIRVNSLAPGLVMNDSVAATFAQRPGMEQHIVQSRAIKRHVYGNELLGTLIFLASPESDAMTGQFLVVDNGGDFA